MTEKRKPGFQPTWTQEEISLLRSLWDKGTTAEGCIEHFKGKYTRQAIAQKARRENMARRKVAIPEYGDFGGMHPMWSMEDDDRRRAFYEKFSKGWKEVQKRLSE